MRRWEQETSHQYTQRKARQQGYWDASKGLPSDPGEHGAREGSAWATWYKQGYQRHEEQER